MVLGNIIGGIVGTAAETGGSRWLIHQGYQKWRGGFDIKNDVERKANLQSKSLNKRNKGWKIWEQSSKIWRQIGKQNKTKQNQHRGKRTQKVER